LYCGGRRGQHHRLPEGGGPPLSRLDERFGRLPSVGSFSCQMSLPPAHLPSHDLVEGAVEPGEIS